uniref:Uncharacterized protein n=2 Tax=Meloidogyne TaxID=189290 RepID=A0A6V7V1F8_MELEN|nr:unnamed protein product [Meloidogyne enterolobii]
MAVQVEPAAIQVPASGGNVSLQLMNGNNEDRFAFKIKSSNNHTTQVEVIRYPGQAGNLLRCGRIGYSKRQGHLPSWIFGRVQGRRSYGCCMSMAAGRT